MRGNFAQSFINLNYNLLQHNPVTKVTYSVFLIIQILTILVFPYFIFFSARLKETSLMRNIYELGAIGIDSLFIQLDVGTLQYEDQKKKLNWRCFRRNCNIRKSLYSASQHGIDCFCSQGSHYTFKNMLLLLSQNLKMPYSKMTLLLQNAGQASVVSSMIILAIMLRRLKLPREQFTVIIFIYLVITFLFLSMYTHIRKKKILGIKEIIVTESLATKWIWAFEHEFQFDENTPLEKLKEIVVNFEIILANHQNKCTNPDCKCKRNQFKKFLKKNNYKVNYEFTSKIKVLLIEIYLQTLLTKQDLEQDNGMGCSIHGLIIVYEWFKINKNYLSCIYNMTKYHDCRKCSLYECFQFYTLQRLIQQEMQQKQMVDQGHVQFQKMVYFESNFKHYQKIIENTIHEISDYWQTIYKNHFDIVKAEKMSNHILQNYQNFLQVYNFMTKECGDIISIESLAWRFHQEILNFDGEAIQNLDKIKQIITKQRFNSKNDGLSLFNFKSCFIVIGALKNNFQKILAASKQLSKLTGYSEDVLLQNTIQIILPNNYAEAHEKYLKNYLKKKRGLLNQSLIANQWIKTNQGILKPVNISVMPKYDAREGLRLIGLIEPIKYFELFDTTLAAKLTYGIFANAEQKIYHISQSCFDQLSLSDDIQALDISINQVFTNIPDDLVNDQTYICDMDLSKCYSNEIREHQEKRKINVESKLLVKLHYKEFRFEGGYMTRQFLFAIIGSRDDQTIRQKITDGRQSSIMQAQGSDKSIEQFQAKHDFSSDSKSLDITSMSSQGSSSSGTSQDTQLNSIKSSIQFTGLPQSLISYWMWLFIGFIVLMLMSFVLLGYNLYTKTRFQNDLNALQNEKRIKNNFLSSNLAMIMTLASQNMPKNFNYTSIQVKKVNQTTFSSYYQTKLGETTNRLHDFLVSFSLNANDWDQSLVEQMNTQQISIKMLTTDGNVMNISQTFYKSITQYLDYMDFLSNSKLSDFKMKHNVFEQNSIEEYSKIIKNTTGNQKIITQYISFVLFNAGNSFLEKLDEIDDAFLDKIDLNGHSLIKVILIIALCSSGLVVIIFSLYIPYCFGVEQLNLKIVKLIYKTDKEVIQEILKHAKEFKDFIEKNRFLLLHSKKKMLSHQYKLNSSIENTDKEEFKENDIHDPQKNKNTDQDIVQNLKSINSLKGLNQKLSSIKHDDLRLSNKSALKHQQLKKEILQQDNEDEDSDEDSNNHKISTQQNSTTFATYQGSLSKKDSKENNEITGQEQLDFYKIALQSRKRKILTLISFFLIGSIFVMFFNTIYFLSNDLFLSFNSAFDLFDIFYLRNVCFTGPHYLLQKSIMLNESLEEGSYAAFQFQKMFDKCSKNEYNYRGIKKSKSGIFAGLIDELEIIDSYQLCEFMIKNKASGNECYTDANGVITLGLEQTVQYVLTTVNQQKINYITMKRMNNAENLEQFFFNREIMQNIAIFYAQLQWVVRYVQEKSKLIFDQKMNENFIQIIVIYSIFEVLVVILAMLCIYKLVQYLKRKLLQIRFILKLLPSTEITKHKSFLEKLNTRLL